MTDSLEAGIVIALVRIVAFCISGLLAYFGYRLFFTVPSKSDSGGKIETPGLTITLSRIAPGTFFAICSACIIIASFVYPITITPQGAVGALGDNPQVSQRNELLEELDQVAPPSLSVAQANQAHVRKALQHLACVRAKYSLIEDEMTALDHARVALMARLWQESWGEFRNFEAWALENSGTAPVAIVEHIYTQKDPRCTN